MTIVVDTGPIIAFVDPREPRHKEVRALLDSCEEPIRVSPFVLAEADHFLLKQVGMRGELAFLLDVAADAFSLDVFEGRDVKACASVIGKYHDLKIGLADASVVLLAERHRTKRILTFDERHFRAMRTAKGEPFVILPADESRPKKKQ